ncbi:MAG: hypothetical protein PHH83_02070 [Patescibacteria group bacterium]|nr:hypothetical protein [Patescibacteria group bacterium]
MEKEQKTQAFIKQNNEPTDEEIITLSHKKGLNSRLNFLDEDGLIPEPRGFH